MEALIEDDTSNEEESDEEIELPEEKSSNFLSKLTKRDKKEKDDSDTDLEPEEEVEMDSDDIGKTAYLNACRKLGLVPVSYFLRHMTDPTVSLAHHGLGKLGMKALSKSLVKNLNIMSLDLSDNWIEGEGGEDVAHIISENCYIADLNVANNKIGSKGIVAICQALQTNAGLRNIDLSGNELKDPDIPHIAEALQLAALTELLQNKNTVLILSTLQPLDNHILKTVNLSRNGLGETFSKILSDAIIENCSIEHLDLSWNHFRLKSGVSICEGIARNSHIRIVNLAMNGLGNEGAFGVAEILKLSATVTYLDVSRNRIGKTGAVVIGKALEGNGLLQTLKIGYNPLGLDGVKEVLKGVFPNKSSVTELDFSGIEVDKEFRNMKEELQLKKRITIEHGPVLSDYVIIGTPKMKLEKLFGVPFEELTLDNIACVIKGYCDANGKTPYDHMLNYDKGKDRKVDITDFFSAFQDAGLELKHEEKWALDNLMTGLKSAEGKVDYSFLK